MTLIPAGAHLAPVDLPPPSPEADPREPHPLNRRGSRTPQKARSPAHSRSASPIRSTVPHPAASDTTSPALHQPMPTVSPVPIHLPHHLSRPSSPASIHSSSSAIFERDIELPAVASLSLNPAQQQGLNHKGSRLHMAHGSALDQTVPSVLDDAVEALANGSSTGIEDLEIEAPAPNGMARQSSALGSRKASVALPGASYSHSRSPSPISIASRVSSPARSPPILAQLGTQQMALTSGSSSPSPTTSLGGVPRPAAPKRLSTGPQVPGGWPSSWQKEEERVSPIEEVRSTLDFADVKVPPVLPATAPVAAIPSHLSPTKDKRRISFISYNDLLLSVPTAVTPLGDITSGNLSPEHLPGTVSPNIATRSPVLASGGPSGVGIGMGVEHRMSWEGMAAARAGGGLGLGEGEWSREGLGKGLEQRLEDLVQMDPSGPGKTTAEVL